jgi:hypothetical protein
MYMKRIITFNKNAKTFILDSFNKAIDKEGYIVEKDNPSKRLIASDGEPLTLDDFVGIRKGSLVFYKSDINSLINLADIIQA